MIDLDDERLADVLASIGGLLVTDPARVDRADIETGDGVRPRTRTHGRAVLAAAVIVVVLVLTTVAVAPIRHTVADWLGIGSTRIEIDPTPPPTTAPLPPIGLGLPRIDRAAAEAELQTSLPALDRTALGTPLGYALMPEGGVVVMWPNDTTLWVHRSSMPTSMLFAKMVAAQAQVQQVDGLGDDALVVVGDHVLRTPHRLVAAATTVLWTEGVVEYRLDAERDVDQLIALARDVAAA